MSPETTVPTTVPLASASWRKSTHSGDQGACVEFALLADPAPDTTIAIRDSKDTTGPVLTFSPAAWTAFTTALPASPNLP
ncbi:DUF397 domain-containing protein [Plantactinospora sp. S1510]|uniref:DUF397 domain-containing protein n=1 Tax=Plantactinospora alkalitolerans TaxID=2789879 RepID=A0ABS0GXI0_9ACTN|nr:DUF397 domain-containing protein [Plantactinospora alkalitolerans]MBF9130911.1 DUF397 domain-containing protein [Plantactinospora alkalitolerans]